MAIKRDCSESTGLPPEDVYRTVRAYRKNSATRPCGSKGIGGCATSMKLCSLSSGCESTGLNLRVSPNDGLQLLALAVMLAPPLDNPQGFSVFGQKRHQVVTCAALHGTTIVV